MKSIYALCICALLGCRGAKPSPAPGPCTKANDPCEFAPGKLGLCVDQDVTGNGPPKLVCQSQH